MKEVFTCTVPWGVHTEALSRRRMWRHVSCWRIPGVLLCRKNASLTRSACSGRHRAQTLTARRPFFMQMDSCQASSAPASISFSAR